MTPDKNEAIRPRIHDKSPVVLYGVDLQLSDAALAVLRENDIHISACADGRPEWVGRRWRDIPVIAPEDIPHRFGQSRIIICPSLEFWTVHDRLWNLGLENLVPASDLISATEPSLWESAKTASTVHTAILVQQGLLASRRDGLHIPQVNLIVTERCTLNCRYCSTLTPFIAEKRDFAPDDIRVWLERLSAVVDEVVSLHIIGGETFLHPHAAEIIETVAAVRNFRRVSIVTNATLLPPPRVLQAMRGTPKAHVFISNYGPLSRKLSELKAVLTENGIPFDDQPQDDWRDMGVVKRRGRSLSDNRTVFRNCLGKNCSVLLDGNLYRCTRSAFGSCTGLMPFLPADAVSLRESWEMERMRLAIRKLFFETDCLLACDYCDGVDVGSPRIPAGEQVTNAAGSHGLTGCSKKES